MPKNTSKSMPRPSSKTKVSKPRVPAVDLEEIDPVKNLKIIESIDPVEIEPVLAADVVEDAEIIEEETEEEDETETLGGGWDE